MIKLHIKNQNLHQNQSVYHLRLIYASNRILICVEKNIFFVCLYEIVS